MTADMNTAALGWTDEQWARITRTIADEARRARVAAAFLPTCGPLDASTTAIPPLRMTQTQQPPPPGAAFAPPIGPPPQRLFVDTDPTLMLTTISTLAYLRTSEVAEPDLSSALAIFRRAAGLIARTEDCLVFRGQPGANVPPIGTPGPLLAVGNVSGGGQSDGLLPFGPIPPVLPPRRNVLIPGPNPNDLVTAIAAAIGQLEAVGQFGPFVGVLSQNLFVQACTPDAGSLIMPRDRMLPFLEGGLYRSSAIPGDLGVVLALGGSPFEIVVASDISARFLQINTEPRYVFRVAERVALRTKELEAIAVLHH